MTLYSQTKPHKPPYLYPSRIDPASTKFQCFLRTKDYSLLIYLYINLYNDTMLQYTPIQRINPI